MPVVKNQRGFWGNFFELFSRKSVKFAFSRNRCAVNITTAVWPPPLQIMSGPMGEIRRAVAYLFFNRF